jgi:hypothetical protein
MKQLELSRGEIKWLLLSGFASALFLGLGALYAWNNRVPDIAIPQAAPPSPNAFDFFQKAAAAYVPPRLGSRIDAHIDTTLDHPVVLFSPEYSRRYPLARQLAFLKQNTVTLRLLRRGLQYSYLQPPERDARTPAYYSRYRDMARLLLVEAHARAQRGNWDGATDSLLDTFHLGYEVPRGGALIAGLTGMAICAYAVKDFKAVLPHISPAKARNAARKIEKWQSTRVREAQSLEEEKRAMQGAILELIRSRDFRPLYVVYACLEGCGVSDERYHQDLDALPMLLKMRLAWMNKPRLLREYTRCMDWQIEQAEKPYPLRAKNWPFPESSDGVESMVYPQFRRMRNTFERCNAQSALLTTQLALHAFRLEKHRYLKRISELVPEYLARVPLDPFSNRQPLRYRFAPVRYIARTWAEPPPPPVVRSSSPVPQPGNYHTVHRYGEISFTLYSIGPNVRDDGGAPYLSDHDTDVKRYVVDLRLPDTAQADIVAGIN